jgi:DNA invertase Pin-like site-specific DNA recombinase
MSVGVYIRVSSESQRLDSQRAELERWLSMHGYQDDQVAWYEDKVTGKSMDRPAFRKLEKDVSSGLVRTVVVWKLDRIARKITDGVNTIGRWCEGGVRVVSTTQQIDLSGPIGHMIASMLFGIAEIELQHAKERQAAGIAVAKKKGVYQGRKPGTTKADPRRVRELKAKGLKTSEIAQALGVSPRSVRNYLKEEPETIAK